MTRKIFADLMSQPARAIIIFCRVTGIEAEIVIVNLSKGEHRTQEYRTLNPLGKIPCLSEDGFNLGESAAILRYLANTNSVPDHWYPAEPRARARVDSALDWHHLNIRRGSAGVALNRVLAPSLGRPKNAQAAQESEVVLIWSLKMLERFWLKGRDYVAGDSISIADLLMVTELDMLNLIEGSEGKSLEELFAPFELVRAWMQRVVEATAPHHTEVSRTLMKVAAGHARRASEAQKTSKL